METLSIKIKIGDRIYPMKVQSEDEVFLRQASKILEERIRQYQRRLRIQDQQDVLAMVAFDCLVESLKSHKKHSTDTYTFMKKITMWSSSIKKALQQDH